MSLQVQPDAVDGCALHLSIKCLNRVYAESHNARDRLKITEAVNYTPPIGDCLLNGNVNSR